MQLQPVLDVLEAVAPQRLAASWDNTGLLVRGDRDIRRIGVCIDLTEPVLAELEAAEVDLVVAYHPTLFKGLKRLVGRSPTERVIARLLRRGVHLYAPHTALDAAKDGMGDWLAASFGPTSSVTPITPDPLEPTVGMGRRGALAIPTVAACLLAPIKEHLGLQHLRVAGDLAQIVSSFAVCPGAGGSLFEGLGSVDLLLTGEMRHHDVLARVGAGSVVVLTEHTNTERGFLKILCERLESRLSGVECVLSRVDADPLTIL